MYDIDSMAPPIELTVNGKVYKVINLDVNALTQLDKIADDFAEDKIEMLYQRFAFVTNTDIEKTRKIEVRKIKLSIETILKAISGDTEVKNVLPETS